jgi:predicted nucleotidyltransferase
VENLKKLKKIIEALGRIQSVKLVVLYGSYARKVQSAKSDIDLLIVADRKDHDKIEDILAASELNIQPIIKTAEEFKTLDSGLLSNILRDGKILYFKDFEIPVPKMLIRKPWIVYTFELKNLNQCQKRRFNFALYGEKKKKYKYSGVLGETKGIKIGSGCILVPQEGSKKIEKLFSSHNIKFTTVKTWGESGTHG